jgi:hypothetical protein
MLVPPESGEDGVCCIIKKRNLEFFMPSLMQDGEKQKKIFIFG